MVHIKQNINMLSFSKTLIVLMVVILPLSACKFLPENYSDDYGENDDYSRLASKPVTVPYSYHFSKHSSPTNHKDRDLNWVRAQNPYAYTIRLTDDEKASNVAKVIHVTPQHERKAQIKYQQHGQTIHTGVYGSFNDMTEAKQALEQLPPNIRQRAKIENWRSVQQQLPQEEILSFDWPIN